MSRCQKKNESDRNEGYGVVWRAIFHLRRPTISTETTRPYTAIIPDMTTGIRDYRRLVVRKQHMGKKGAGKVSHLHDEFWLELTKPCNANTRFRCSIRSTDR